MAYTRKELDDRRLAKTKRDLIKARTSKDLFNNFLSSNAPRGKVA